MARPFVAHRMGLLASACALALMTHPASADLKKKDKHGHGHTPVRCGPVACNAWVAHEVTELVYDYQTKEVVKKVKVPVIREKKVEVPFKWCDPVARGVVREVFVPNYNREIHEGQKKIYNQTTDDCGKCKEECQVVPELVSCILRSVAPQIIPVVAWESVPAEHTYTLHYFFRDWEEVPILVTQLTKTPKTITRKVWKRTPACSPGEEKCDKAPAADAPKDCPNGMCPKAAH